MRMQRVAHYLVLAFKMILVYFQHTFHCLINEAAYHTNLVLLIICLIIKILYEDVLFRRKHFLKMGKIRYNGWFYKMAMVPFDMIIFKETGRLIFPKPIEIF